jgi:hypothetical protein
MAIDLRQSTASQEIPLGIFVDSLDGNTEEASLTINNTDIKIWKTGATTLASKNSGGATYISNGIYYCVLDATDTDTIGPLIVFVHVSGALAVRVECNVLDEAVYDVKYGTVAPATISNITGGTITTVTNLTNAPTSGDLTSTMKTSVENAVLNADMTGHQTQGSLGQAIGDPVADTNTIYKAVVTDAAGANIAADIIEIEGQTDDIGVAGAGLTAAGPSAANIRSAVGLASANLDTQLDALPTAAENADAVWDELKSGHTTPDTFGDYLDDEITSRATAADVPTAAVVADAVWDEDATAHQTQGTFGQAIGDPGADTDTIFGLANTNLDAAISTRATPAQVNTEVDTAIADARLDELLAADSDIDGAAPPAVGSVIHEMLTKTAGSFTYDQTTDSQEALRDNLATASALATVQADTDDIQLRLPAALVGGRMASNAEVVGDKTGYSLSSAGVQAIWDALTSALTTVGSIGKRLVDNIDVVLSTRASQTSVDDLPTNAELSTALGTADDATLAAIADIPTNAELATALDAIPTAAENAAAVNAPSAATIAAAVWASVIETGFTALQSMRLILAAAAGKLSGAATTNVLIRDVNDTKDRIDATVDASGNRTAVTHDVS